MKRAVLSAALAAVFVAGVSAQDTSKFVGSWRIDPSRSDQFSSAGAPVTIAVEGNKMTITSTQAGNTTEAVRMLDGTPVKTVSGQGDKKTEGVHSSTWEGHVLVTAWPRELVTRVEKRWIQEDGTMRVEVTFNYKDGRPSNTGYQVLTRVK